MKKNLQVFLLIVSGLVAGCYLREWRSQKPRHPPETQDYTVIDTITVYDTIPYSLPAAKQEIPLGTRITLLPVFIPGGGNNDSINIPLKCNIEGENILPDSVAVEVPITQKEYEGKEYHAWVSGYEARLDSLYIYPQHEVVTIGRSVEKTKRWGVGVFAGYGITPLGFQPCIGISLNYTLWNF